MADPLLKMTIAFKPGPAQAHPTTLHCRITAAELAKLANDAQQRKPVGVYAITDDDNQVRTLFVHFEDVLYIA